MKVKINHSIFYRNNIRPGEFFRVDHEIFMALPRDKEMVKRGLCHAFCMDYNTISTMSENQQVIPLVQVGELELQDISENGEQK